MELSSLFVYPFNVKTFILLSAVAGSGKSTWAEQYRLTHKNVFIVSSDALRKELGGAYQNFEHEAEVWNRFYSDIEKYRDENEDVTVIADSTNIINKFRILYGKNLTGFDKKILVVIKKDKDQILQTNRLRNENRIVPDYAIENMCNNWEEPDEETLSYYDEYIRIDKWFDSPQVKEDFHYRK